MDCVIRRGEWYNDLPVNDQNIPGFNIVGTILVRGPESRFTVGDRVATVTQIGGNCRFTTQSSDILLKIGKNDDAHSICAILSAYIPAFALIQNGMKDHVKRYEKEVLSGSNVLVNGSMGMHGQAVVHLARLLGKVPQIVHCLFYASLLTFLSLRQTGAKNVFATAKQKDYQHLMNIGAIPLPLNSRAVIKEHNQSFDLIIDTTSTDTFDILVSLKKPGGRIVFDQYGDINKDGRHGFRSKVDLLLLHSKTFLTDNCHICNYLHNFCQHSTVFKASQSNINSFS